MAEHWDSCDGSKRRWDLPDGSYRMLCECQAANNGWCLGCGHFLAGFEHYDFSPVRGYCGDCVEDMDRETDPSFDAECE